MKTGPLQEDDLRVISEGLKPGERVITSRLQMVRPGMTVKVEEISMPTSPADEPLSDRKNPGGKKN